MSGGQQPAKSGAKPKSAKPQEAPNSPEAQQFYDSELGLDPAIQTNYLTAQDLFNKMKKLEDQFVHTLNENEKKFYDQHLEKEKEYKIEPDGEVPETGFALDIVNHPKRDEIGKYVTEIEKYRQQFDETIKKFDSNKLTGKAFIDFEVMRGEAHNLAKRIEPIYQSYQQINIGQVVKDQTNVAGDQVAGDKKEVYGDNVREKTVIQHQTNVSGIPLEQHTKIIDEKNDLKAKHEKHLEDTKKLMEDNDKEIEGKDKTIKILYGHRNHLIDHMETVLEKKANALFGNHPKLIEYIQNRLEAGRDNHAIYGELAQELAKFRDHHDKEYRLFTSGISKKLGFHEKTIRTGEYSKELKNQLETFIIALSKVAEQKEVLSKENKTE